jgi:hypothetical protein
MYCFAIKQNDFTLAILKMGQPYIVHIPASFSAQDHNESFCSSPLRPSHAVSCVTFNIRLYIGITLWK